MQDLLDRDTRFAFRVEDNERLARAELRRQIGRLEWQLATLVAEAFPRLEVDTGVPAPCSAPRALGLGELEALRDALAIRVADARRALRERADREARNRELLDQMLARPAEFPWMQISRADIGEPGCGHWHSRPRLGPVGMLMGWWRVKVSSGCPLPGRLAAVEHETQSRRDGPPAPWGSFPLAELTVLAGIVMLAVGIVGDSRAALGVGLVLGALGGLEVSVREHIAGYRSHTTLLAATLFVLSSVGFSISPAWRCRSASPSAGWPLPPASSRCVGLFSGRPAASRSGSAACAADGSGARCSGGRPAPASRLRRARPLGAACPSSSGR